MKKKYFGTDGIRGRVGKAPISADWMLKLGWAAGKVLSQHFKKNHPKVLIGKDTRISGYMFESALEAGFSASGVDICLLGPMPTPAIAYLTRELQANAGIVISASHNGYNDNGIKFICANGYKLSDEIELAIEAMIDSELVTVEARELGKATRAPNAEQQYVDFCKNSFYKSTTNQTPLNLKIVLDCAHGATYHMAPTVFKDLGADVIAIGVEPDGFNINKNCGSTNLNLLKKTVLQNNADLGIAFDGDGDRVLMVDKNGEILNGDELLFILANWYKSQDKLTQGVVGTQMTNLGLELALQELDIPFIRSKVGDRYGREELNSNGWNLGGESSGHIICSDFNTTGDGIIAALQILANMHSTNRSLSELKQGMTKLPQILINIESSNPKAVIQDQEVLKATVDAEKTLGNNGRILLRASGTEPVVRVMAEGKDFNSIKNVANEIARTIKDIISVETKV